MLIGILLLVISGLLYILNKIVYYPIHAIVLHTHVSKWFIRLANIFYFSMMILVSITFGLGMWKLIGGLL